MSYNQQKIQRIIDNKKRQQEIERQNKAIAFAKRQEEEQLKQQQAELQPKKVIIKKEVPKKKCKYADKETDANLFSAYAM